MKSLIAVAAVSGAMVLSGCAAFTGESVIRTLNEAQPTGSAFTQGLYEGYRDFANFEWNDMFDYEDAVYFARKGLLAAQGEVVPPEELGNWRLPEDIIGELSAARAQLVALLDATAREQAPLEAAVAQTRFDCWVEQQEENWQEQDIAACREEFREALAALQAAMAPPVAEPAPAPLAPSVYLVFFDFDRAELTPTAQEVLAEVAEQFRQAGANRIQIIGHTDTAGPAVYNEKLSMARAQAVAEGLVELGIPATAIDARGVGEEQLLVQTADGVREPSNRRAEIRFQ